MNGSQLFDSMVVPQTKGKSEQRSIHTSDSVSSHGCLLSCVCVNQRHPTLSAFSVLRKVNPGRSDTHRTADNLNRIVCLPRVPKGLSISLDWATDPRGIKGYTPGVSVSVENVGVTVRRFSLSPQTIRSNNTLSGDERWRYPWCFNRGKSFE